MIRTTKELAQTVNQDKNSYRDIRLLMELDLEEAKNLLCTNNNPDVLRLLQGKAQKLIELIKILT